MSQINVLKKGLIISFLIIASSLFTFYVLNWSEKGNIQYINIGLFVLGIFWTVYETSRKEEFVTIKTMFNDGFKYFMLVTLLLTIFTFIFYRLNPQILETVLVENNKLIATAKNKTPAEISENSKKIRSIFMPMMLMFTVIRYLLLGSISSLVTAYFIQLRKP
jgi:hypothetical protein